MTHSHSNGLEYIGSESFSHCSWLTNITIPGTGSTKIDYFAFFYSHGLNNVIIEEGVIEIGHDCFAQTGVKTLKLPNSIQRIDYSAFEQCYQLISIEFGNSNSNDHEIVIGSSLFYLCSSLNSIAFPYGLTYLNNGCLRSCKSLKSVTLPETITGLGNNAFEGCSQLTSITLPSSLQNINDNVFNSCTNLKCVIFRGSNSYPFYGSDLIGATIYVNSDYEHEEFRGGTIVKLKTGQEVTESDGQCVLSPDTENPDQQSENPDQQSENPDQQPENPDQQSENPNQQPENPDQQPENPDQQP